MTTKQRIIYQSLKLFSEKGYSGVSMREIAAAVGIKGASLYNHFKGKEDIFSAIFEEMTRQYSEAAAAMNIPSDDSGQSFAVFQNIGETELMHLTESLFSYFALNSFVAMFRKLLISEQFRFPDAAKCYKDYYLDAPVIYQTAMFAAIQQHGGFAGYDPKTLAIHFYSPVYYTLCRYDAGEPYDECLETLKKHIGQFIQTYVK